MLIVLANFVFSFSQITPIGLPTAIIGGVVAFLIQFREAIRTDRAS
jgi:hypothetical protein